MHWFYEILDPNVTTVNCGDDLFVILTSVFVTTKKGLVLMYLDFKWAK